jgi:hypothetical protein
MMLPYCQTMAGFGYCVECLGNANCAPDAGRGGGMNQPICRTSDFTCVACNDDTTCTTGMNTHCRISDNTCVACTANEHCGDANRVCNTNNTCGCPMGMTQCTTGGGRGSDAAATIACHNVQTDPAHCGNCMTACDVGESCVAGDCVGPDAGMPPDAPAGG